MSSGCYRCPYEGIDCRQLTHLGVSIGVRAGRLAEGKHEYRVAPVNAESDAAMRGSPYLKGIKQEPELAATLFLAHADVLEHLLLHRIFVDAQAASCRNYIYGLNTACCTALETTRSLSKTLAAILQPHLQSRSHSRPGRMLEPWPPLHCTCPEGSLHWAQ